MPNSHLHGPVDWYYPASPKPARRGNKRRFAPSVAPSGNSTPGRHTGRHRSALFKRFVNELYNKQRIEIVDKVFSPDFIGHYDYGDVHGINMWKENHYKPLIRAFSDLHVEIEDIITNGDYVVSRRKTQAVHTGDLFEV